MEEDSQQIEEFDFINIIKINKAFLNSDRVKS